ncbi:MAG TPA: hypothetical protein VID27_14855 [Blastocatellia bacterium]|jgi:hypothetical protein
MTEKVCAIEEIKEKSVGEVLREVADNRESLTVVLEDGDTVVIRPATPLKPLPALEGFVPQGWKEDIYGE